MNPPANQPPPLPTADQPVILSYRSPEAPPAADLRRPIRTLPPFSLGVALGTTVGFVALMLALRRRLDCSMGVAAAIVFLIVWATTTVTCWFVIGFRQLLTRRLLSARPNRTCFWTGVVIGMGDTLVPFALIYFKPPLAEFNNGWILLSLPLIGPLIASIVLLTPAVWRD
jgi:hypothetical protein